MSDFTSKLEEIMAWSHLSASALADKVGVQRSGISHLLSGRNKPSLDFIVKLTEEFPEINLYWLLTGKGKMLNASILQSDDPTIMKEAIPGVRNIPPVTPPLSENISTQISGSHRSDILKIILLYKDGTFESYLPGEK